MKEFNLTFLEALEIVMKGEGWIRSEIMNDGVYLKLDQMGTLTIYDGFDFNTRVDEYTVTTNSFNSKWKTFSVANRKNLTK